MALKFGFQQHLAKTGARVHGLLGWPPSLRLREHLAAPLVLAGEHGDLAADQDQAARRRGAGRQAALVAVEDLVRSRLPIIVTSRIFVARCLALI